MKKKARRGQTHDVGHQPQIRVERGATPADEVLPPIRVTFGEKKIMQEKADQYACGNLSRWLRFAATRFVPSSEQMEPELSDDDPLIS